MILKNGLVMCDDFTLRKKDVRIENGYVLEIGDKLIGDEIIDVSNEVSASYTG